MSSMSTGGEASTGEEWRLKTYQTQEGEASTSEEWHLKSCQTSETSTGEVRRMKMLQTSAGGEASTSQGWRLQSCQTNAGGEASNGEEWRLRRGPTNTGGEASTGAEWHLKTCQTNAGGEASTGKQWALNASQTNVGGQVSTIEGLHLNTCQTNAEPDFDSSEPETKWKKSVVEKWHGPLLALRKKREQRRESQVKLQLGRRERKARVPEPTIPDRRWKDSEAKAEAPVPDTNWEDLAVQNLNGNSLKRWALRKKRRAAMQLALGRWMGNTRLRETAVPEMKQEESQTKWESSVVEKWHGPLLKARLALRKKREQRKEHQMKLVLEWRKRKARLRGTPVPDVAIDVTPQEIREERIVTSSVEKRIPTERTLSTVIARRLDAGYCAEQERNQGTRNHMGGKLPISRVELMQMMEHLQKDIDRRLQAFQVERK